MSTENENKKESKIARVEFIEFSIDPQTQTVSFKAKLRGKVKSADVWAINDAETIVSGVKVPAREFAQRVLQGWFWVRKIQDELRKGHKKDAEEALKVGYDWTASTATKERTAAAPAVVAERAMSQMNLEQIEELLKKAQELQKKMRNQG